jgi:hypothetical protein
MSATLRYTREEARIKAVQHAWIKNHYGQATLREPKKPMEFEQWFLNGIRYYEKKGFEFEVLTPGLVLIRKAGQKNMLRTVKDYRREYENFYLPSF